MCGKFHDYSTSIGGVEFVNTAVGELEFTGTGCKLGGFFLGVIMYADDILLLLPPITGLQTIPDKCTYFFHSRFLEFKGKKSSCFVLEPATKYEIKLMILQKESINWSKSFKYLRINCITGSKLKIDIDIIKRKFFAS